MIKSKHHGLVGACDVEGADDEGDRVGLALTLPPPQVQHISFEANDSLS